MKCCFTAKRVNVYVLSFFTHHYKISDEYQKCSFICFKNSPAALENTWYFFQTIFTSTFNFGYKGLKQSGLSPAVLMSLSKHKTYPICCSTINAALNIKLYVAIIFNFRSFV
jgi:hypothetical protein